LQYIKVKINGVSVPSKRNTVIIIDDSNQTKFNLKKYLRVYNYKVIACKDILNGIRIAQIRLPEIIFLDISDHEINDVETLKIIKKNSLLKKLSVIHVIKDATKEKFQSILLAGAAGIIAKPIRKEAVAKIVKEILGNDYYMDVEDTFPNVECSEILEKI